MHFKAITNKNDNIYDFKLTDNNNLNVMNLGHLQLETKPRTISEINGLDLYTVIDQVMKHLILINHDNKLNNEILLHLADAELAMEKSKDHRVYRGDFFNNY